MFWQKQKDDSSEAKRFLIDYIDFYSELFWRKL